ncbi:FadR/GntR family transcriptional regulator [Granulosicoccus sp. 3-233]|uniref:FadR/GntR family transcriptional regulator n=1 Tax=Granulosicoccus sp. 3-233 TaxID=3417969 RepID=UPI003D344B78
MKAPGKGQKPRLAAEIEADLRTRILAGEPPVGEKLATERALCLTYGVSRTVIREVIAGLRAAGLIESRRGSGLFVRANTVQESPWQAAMPQMQAEIVAIVDTLELRAAVEIEAAFLAATRASPGQIARIRSCHQQFAEAVETGAKTEEADYDFHQAIAEATNNSAYRSFMEYLGKRTIPRGKLGLETTGEPYRAYLVDMQSEHLDILEAIERHRAEDARQAMQAHLVGSLERYRALSQS